MKQFQENLGILTQLESDDLMNTKVLIVGLGGLGGYIANSLTRLGVKSMILVDYDSFEVSNLNRQLFSQHINLGEKKTDVLKRELLSINPFVNITTYSNKIETLDDSLLQDIDILIDAVDNIHTKCYLEKLGTKLNKPLLHGAIGGWFGQFGLIMPGSNLLNELYETHTPGLEKTLKSPTFTPGIIANLMVSEFVKFITKKEHSLINQIMMIDLLNHDYQIIFDKSK